MWGLLGNFFLIQSSYFPIHSLCVFLCCSILFCHPSYSKSTQNQNHKLQCDVKRSAFTSVWRDWGREREREGGWGGKKTEHTINSAQCSAICNIERIYVWIIVSNTVPNAVVQYFGQSKFAVSINENPNL